MIRTIVFSLILIFPGGYADAAKPPKSSKIQENSALRNRASQVKLYERTLRRHLASDPYPLIDMEVSLDRWKSTAQLIVGMNRAGVALGAVTATREEAIKKAVEQYPGRLIPLTSSADQNRWAQPGSGYISGIKRQLESGAFGIGKISWRPESYDKAQISHTGKSLGAMIRLATQQQSFLMLEMPPDDGGLELLERLLRAAPEARIVWTQVGRVLNPKAIPGYGHGLLRAMSLRHANLFFTLTQDLSAAADSPPPRTNHLYDPGGAFSREWRALLEARVGHFTAGNDSSPASPKLYASRTLFFRQNVLGNLSPPARKLIAYQNAWRLMTNRYWKP